MTNYVEFTNILLSSSDPEKDKAINIPDSFGNTILHYYACLRGVTADEKLFKLLFGKGLRQVPYYNLHLVVLSSEVAGEQAGDQIQS